MYGVSIEDALMAITSNPADVLGLKKGNIAINTDADLVLMDSQSLKPLHVLSQGTLMVDNGFAVIKGPFE